MQKQNVRNNEIHFVIITSCATKSINMVINIAPIMLL